MRVQTTRPQGTPSRAYLVTECTPSYIYDGGFARQPWPRPLRCLRHIHQLSRHLHPGRCHSMYGEHQSTKTSEHQRVEGLLSHACLYRASITHILTAGFVSCPLRIIYILTICILSSTVLPIWSCALTLPTSAIWPPHRRPLDPLNPLANRNHQPTLPCHLHPGRRSRQTQSAKSAPGGKQPSRFNTNNNSSSVEEPSS